MDPTNGITAREESVKDTSAILDAVIKVTPRGGVLDPTHRFNKNTVQNVLDQFHIHKLQVIIQESIL